MFFFISGETTTDKQDLLRIADIYERHRFTCLHIAMKITHDQQMAEDAVADAFVEVIKKKEKILALKSDEMLAYIAVAVKSRALNILGKHKRIIDTAPDDLDDLFQAHEKPVEEQVAGAIGYDRLVALIKHLDEKYRRVFELKYILGLSNGEIASEVSITQKNVEMRLYRAKLKLRELIGSEVTANV